MKLSSLTLFRSKTKETGKNCEAAHDYYGMRGGTPHKGGKLSGAQRYGGPWRSAEIVLLERNNRQYLNNTFLINIVVSVKT